MFMKDIDLSQRIYGEVLVLVSSTTDCLSVQVSFLSVMLSLLPSESVVLLLECRTGCPHYKPVLKWT